MSISLLSKFYECYVCHSQRNLQKHHIFEGTGRRDLSEKYGCWIYLCARHHNMSDAGIHFNRDFDRKLKRLCQIELEKKESWSKEDFIRVFGKSYE